MLLNFNLRQKYYRVAIQEGNESCIAALLSVTHSHAQNHGLHTIL